MYFAGVGTFFFNLVTRYLIDKYTWRGTVLILGGILLNGVVCGLLFLPMRENSPREEEAERFLAAHTDAATALPNKAASINDRDCEVKVELCLVEPSIDLGKKVSGSNNEKKVEASGASPPPGFLSACNSLVNFELLSDARCWLFLLSAFMVQLAFTVPFNLLPDQAVENNMSKYQASWLISGIGIVNYVVVQGNTYMCNAMKKF